MQGGEFLLPLFCCCCCCSSPLTAMIWMLSVHDDLKPGAHISVFVFAPSSARMGLIAAALGGSCFDGGGCVVQNRTAYMPGQRSHIADLYSRAHTHTHTILHTVTHTHHHTVTHTVWDSISWLTRSESLKTAKSGESRRQVYWNLLLLHIQRTHYSQQLL